MNPELKIERSSWQPSKFQIQNNVIRSSKDASELSRSSRINADLIGEFYSRVIPTWVRGDLVDLGCGKAPLLGVYRHYCSDITLADWDEPVHSKPLLDVVADLNSPLTDFDSCSFDTVILSDVLEHVREPRLLLTEINRILRPGGTLLMNTPFIYNIHLAPHDYFRYTRFALAWMAENAGLEVVELVSLGGGLEVLGDLLSKVAGRANLWLIAKVLHKLTMTLHRTSVGRRFSERTGEILPIGYGMIARKVQG